MKEQVDQHLVIDIAGPSMQFFIHQNVVVPNLIVQVEALDTSIENFDDNNNKESDDVSSNAYEFVDGTQQNDHEKVLSEHGKSTPDKVQKDMQFLQESWANPVEKEDEENSVTTCQIQNETEAKLVVAHQKDTRVANVEEKGFQLVRTKKKKHKPLS